METLDTQSALLYLAAFHYSVQTMQVLRYLLSLLLAGLLFSCEEPVEKIRPTVGKITESVYASGIVKSKNQYQVYATVSGLIEQILIREGDLVKKGDALFVIKNETSRLNTENAGLADEFAEWNRNGDRLNELKGAIEVARLKMLNDSTLLVRQRGLWAQQIGSRVELEQRELAYTSSVNAFQAAVLRYKDLKKQLDFLAEQSKKQLSISKNIAQDYIVRSQTDGRVYNITKEKGEIVGTQSALAIIGAADDFELELQIDENDIARIKPGLRTLLTLDSYKGAVFEAVITRIDPIMNERTRTLTVKAEFAQKPPVLYPNLTVEANIVIQTKENALTIPRAFLTGDSLVVLENGSARKVETGLKDYQKAEILSGLHENETIQKPD